jgi:hypothetical protein
LGALVDRENAPPPRLERARIGGVGIASLEDRASHGLDALGDDAGAATMQLLSDGRFTLGLGAGENLNEHIVGGRWPIAGLRHEMLEEAVEIIRALWTGETVTYRGKHFDVAGRVGGSGAHGCANEGAPSRVNARSSR